MTSSSLRPLRPPVAVPATLPGPSTPVSPPLTAAHPFPRPQSATLSPTQAAAAGLSAGVLIGLALHYFRPHKGNPPRIPAAALSGAVDRRAALHTAAAGAAAAWLTPGVARAWCGDLYPEWAYKGMAFNEGLVPLPDGAKLFVRAVGQEKEERKQKAFPVLVIPGGPLLPHNYLETLEALAAPPGVGGRSRRVLLYDPIGTGLSQGGPPATDVLGAALEALAPLQVLELTQKPVHVLAHGTGAAAALGLVASGRIRPASLVLASPLVGSPIPFPPAGAGMFGEPGSEFYQSRILGSNDGATGTACVVASLEVAPPPEEARRLAQAIEQYDPQPGLTALRAANIPVLVTRGGPRDLCTALAAETLGAAVAAQTLTFPEAAHLPHITAKEAYVAAVLGFLGDVERAAPA
eukprot:EG_transcript_9574